MLLSVFCAVALIMYFNWLDFDWLIISFTLLPNRICIFGLFDARWTSVLRKEPIYLPNSSAIFCSFSHCFHNLSRVYFPFAKKILQIRIWKAIGVDYVWVLRFVTFHYIRTCQYFSIFHKLNKYELLILKDAPIIILFCLFKINTQID